MQSLYEEFFPFQFEGVIGTVGTRVRDGIDGRRAEAAEESVIIQGRFLFFSNIDRVQPEDDVDQLPNSVK